MSIVAWETLLNAFTITSIDDHDLFRSGIEMIVQSSFPEATFASFESLGQALENQPTAPAIVLLDLHLNGIGGRDAIPLIKLRWPACAIIVVTSEPDHAEIERVLDAGGDAVVLKSEPPVRFINAIRSFVPAPLDNDKASADLTLSRRQLEVLQHLREGYSNKAIAKRLGISEFTVRGHVQQVLKLLNVSNRAQAVFQAQSSGLL